MDGNCQSLEFFKIENEDIYLIFSQIKVSYRLELGGLFQMKIRQHYLCAFILLNHVLPKPLPTMCNLPINDHTSEIRIYTGCFLTFMASSNCKFVLFLPYIGHKKTAFQAEIVIF